jgi:hypothetical protein
MTPEAFFASATPAVQALCLHLLRLVREELPGSEEIVFEGWKNVSFGTGHSRSDKDLILYIAPLKDSVNLGFYRGTALPDVDQLLKGTGKQLRHVKFKAGEALAEAQVRTLIREARAERLGV